MLATKELCVAIRLVFALILNALLWSQPLTLVNAQSNPRSAQASTIGAVQGGKEFLVLEPGKAVERDLGGGQNHQYHIRLISNQYLHLVVEQKGIDVAVLLFDPEDKKLAEVDSPNGTQGPEPVSVIANVSGNYRLEVRSPEKEAPPGRYVVKIADLRDATPQDKTRLAADSIYTEGRQQQERRTATSLRKAIEKYEQALPLWRAAGARTEEADTISNIAESYEDLGERQKALDYFNQALALRRAAADGRGEAQTLNNIASVYGASGEKEKALDYFNKALLLWRTAGDRTGEAATLSNIGEVYSSLGDPQKALAYYNQALPIRRAVNDRAGQAATLNNMGGVYYSLGEPQKALEYYNQALPLVRAEGDRRGAAYTLTNMGLVYDSLGEKQKALDQYGQALKALKDIGDRYGTAATLNNIALLYLSLNENKKALDYYGQALTLIQSLGDRYGQASVLNGIGKIYHSSGEYQKALDFFNQVLPLRRAVGDRAGEAATLHNIAAVYEALREKQKAFDYYGQALALWKVVGDRRGEANTLNSIGTVHRDLGEPEKALGYYNQALPLRRATGDRSGEAATLYGIARVERDRANLITAKSLIEAALTIIESLRTKILSKQLRASYFASVQKYYELHIDLLMRMYRLHPADGFDGAALQVSENARARSLLEMLGEARADIRQGVEPALLERERSLLQSLNAKAERQIRLLGGKHTEEQTAAAAKEIQALTTEYLEVEAQIRATSPRYASLTQPQPLSLKEIQQQLLDKDTMLLEYTLGDERSFLWAVTQTSIASFELPKREEIETAARRFYELLTAPTQQYRVMKDTRGLRVAKADAQDQKVAEAAAALSKLVLSPVASRLKQKRLLIVSEGALQYVPFAALPDPSSQSDRPLVLEHEIVSLPSASTLAVLRRELSGRKPAPKALAVLADPVFDSHDERTKLPKTDKKVGERTATSAEQRGLTIKVQKAAGDSGMADAEMGIPRLPGTRQEAETILNLVPATDRKQALDFAADRATATSDELGQYRFVHFATHGLLNSKDPELSGIVLSLVDEQGSEKDGFLLAPQIYNLKLPAELVVLSACQTGLGKEVRGEGLVGLTRGFMYAGAARVIVSLWSVDDEATGKLMVSLYRGMLKEGLRPAAALRAAQVKMWKQKRWRAPYYWAAFVLQGEWR